MKIWANVRNYIKNTLYRWRKHRLGLCFPLYCKVRGVKINDYQGAIVQSRAGDPLQLVHSPEEKYPYNVYVYNVSLNRILGYLDKDLSKRLVKLFSKDFIRDGVIENITGGEKKGYKYYGCNIRILESMVFLREKDDFSHLKG